MISFYRYALVWCVAIVALTVIGPRANAQNATEIAITGVTIPGSSGNAFSAFDQPVINSVGQVAFLGFFPGGQGIFSVNGLPVNNIPNSQNGFPVATREMYPGAGYSTLPGITVPLLNSIWLTGNADGTNSQGLFSAFTVDPPANPSGVALNNTTSANTIFGQMAITGQLNGNSIQGIYTATTPSVITPNRIAVTGAASTAPGTTSTYSNFGNTPALNDNGNIAYVATLASGNQGLFFGPANPARGSVTAIQQTGSAAPNFTGSGTNNLYSTFTGEVSLVSVGSGGNDYLAFQAGVVDVNTGNSSSGIFVYTQGAASIVAETGRLVPGIPGYSYQNFMDPVSVGVGAGQLGVVAFRSNILSVTNPPAAPPTAAALLIASNTNQPIVIGATQALVGQPLPSGYSTTFPNGATYNAFGTVSESLNGQVAFVAALAQIGSVSGGAGGGGIFLSKNQSTSVSHIAVSGDIAPGTNGAFYASFFNDVASTYNPIFNDSSVSINDHLGTNQAHEVAFQAFLAGTSVNGSNNQALFIANDQIVPGTMNQTETALLARSGELLTTNPGVQKTISSFSVPFDTRIGNGASSFNDLGQLVSEVDFTDNTHGIYIFTPDLHLSAFATFNAATPVAWNQAGAWTFAYSPVNQIYRVIINPTDVGLPTITVNGPTANQSIPGLQVGSSTGVANLVLQTGVTLTLGGGAITSGINVLTIQGPSTITTSGTGSTALIKLLGDVTSVAGSGTAVVAPNFDLGNVPFPVATPSGAAPPPSIADIDRFRTLTVARGNFVGAYPVDLLLTGNISSPSETITISDITGTSSTTATNDVHRGILKTGPGTLRLTGANTFGPDTTILSTDDPYTTPPSPPTPTASFVQSIKVTGGLLSFANDGNLGLPPGGTFPTTPATAITVTNPYFVRWITLEGGGIGLMTTALSTLANPTVLDANRGIALGPVTGFGSGTIDVFGTNFLDYEGIMADNTDGVTTGVGSLIKTGAGTLILSGTNTFRGGTTVSQGTLMVTSDAALGAAGTAVTVNALATLNYTNSATTTRSFTLGGTLSVATGKTVTFSNAAVSGGFLSGPGAFATSVGGTTTFTGTTTNPSATLTLKGTDMLTSFTQGGQLTVAAGAGPVAFSQFINQGSGTITLAAGSKVNVADFQTYGLLNIANGTAPGVFTQLTNVGTTPLSFSAGSRTFVGTIGGNGQARLELNGQNAIVTGGLLVNNGQVTDSSASGNATIIADYGALVKGAGAYDNPPITQNGGKFQAGNSPGVATAGRFIFGPGGVNNYVFAIDDATGQAGPTPDAAGHVSGWGLIKTAQFQRAGGATSGDFVWSADPTNQLTVALDTLVNPTTVGIDVPGLMANFDPTKSYSWPAVEWTGAYSGPTDVAALDAATTFDTSGFANPNSGAFGWSFDPAGHQLDLVYSPSAVPEPGAFALVGLAAAAGWRWRRRVK